MELKIYIKQFNMNHDIFSHHFVFSIVYSIQHHIIYTQQKNYQQNNHQTKKLTHKEK